MTTSDHHPFRKSVSLISDKKMKIARIISKMNKSDSAIAEVLKQRAQHIYPDAMGKGTNHLLSQLFYRS